MAVCTRDNPATFCRECWKDGKLVYFVTLALLRNEDFQRSGRLPWPANIGPWEAGQVVGDRAALTAKPEG